MSSAGGGAPAAGVARHPAARKRLLPYALLTPGGIVLLLLFLIPLSIMVYTSLKSGGIIYGFTFSWQFSNYSDGITQNGTFFARSIEYSGIVTLATLLLSYPLSYWIAFHGGRWKSTLLLFVLLPFFVSFVIRTIQWKFILADSGIIFGPLKSAGILPQSFHILATPYAVIAGITYNFLPFAALPLYVALDRIDRDLIEAARDLYASKARTFLHVVLPLSIPGLFAAFLLTFVPATGDYVNADVLGGPGTTMIGNVIQRKFLGNNLYNEAAALSVMLMVGMLVIAAVYARMLGTEDSSLAAGAG